MNILYKAIQNGAIKDVDTKTGVVTGYFSSFGVLDSYGDIVMPGAFKRSIRNNGPKGGDVKNSSIYHLWNHSSEIVGKPHKLKEDKFGLYFETKMDSRREFVKDKLLMYEQGVINQHSIGYSTIKSTLVNDSKGKRQHTELNEVKLFEGSSVLWGANPDTPFTGFKAKEIKDKIIELNERFELFTKEIKDGKYTDETIILLDIEAMKIQDMINSLKAVDPIVKPITQDFDPKEAIDSFMAGYKK